MKEYHKINTIWKRDKRGKIIEGEYSLEEFSYLANCEWEWTEKVDGTNVRIIRQGGAWEFKGKSDAASLPAQLFKYLNAHFADVQASAEDDGIALYGEGFGWKIQKAGPRYSVVPRFILFDVRVGSWWLRRCDVESVATRFGIPAVPVVGRGSLLEACAFVQSGLKSGIAADTSLEAEGLVLRPTVRLLDGSGNRIISKIKARDYK